MLGCYYAISKRVWVVFWLLKRNCWGKQYQKMKCLTSVSGITNYHWPCYNPTLAYMSILCSLDTRCSFVDVCALLSINSTYSLAPVPVNLHIEKGCLVSMSCLFRTRHISCACSTALLCMLRGCKYVGVKTNKQKHWHNYYLWNLLLIVLNRKLVSGFSTVRYRMCAICPFKERNNTLMLNDCPQPEWENPIISVP